MIGLFIIAIPVVAFLAWRHETAGIGNPQQISECKPGKRIKYWRELLEKAAKS